jgi:hypothetical protein
MDAAFAFRRLLARRIIQTVLLTLPAAPLALAGCIGSGTSGGGTVTDRDVCFPWPVVENGTTTGSGGAGAGGAGGSGGSEQAPCPAYNDNFPDQWATDPGIAFNESVIGPSTKLQSTATSCCYTFRMSSAQTGRPFLVESEMRTAPIQRGAGDRWEESSAMAPRTADLTAGERAELAGAWMRDGLFEHASIASFGRFALELLAVGAPSELIEQAHRAALDEVRHARLCLGLASAYADETVAPARFPFDGRVEVDASLAGVAARAAREGCIGETLAAFQAAEQLAHAEDPAVRAALAIIADDEARHAELAWRTVAWALRTGGAEVRAAVSAVFAEVDGGAPTAEIEAQAEGSALRAHGRLSDAEGRTTQQRSLRDVVFPCARAMLGADETATLLS